MSLYDDEKLLPPSSFSGDIELMEDKNFPRIEELEDIMTILGEVNESESLFKV